MIDALQDTKDLVLTAISFVPQALEMMDSSAEKLNMEEVLAILGSSVMGSMTNEWGLDVKEIMEEETVKKMDFFSILNVS